MKIKILILSFFLIFGSISGYTQSDNDNISGGLPKVQMVSKEVTFINESTISVLLFILVLSALIGIIIMIFRSNPDPLQPDLTFEDDDSTAHQAIEKPNRFNRAFMAKDRSGRIKGYLDEEDYYTEWGEYYNPIEPIITISDISITEELLREYLEAIIDGDAECSKEEVYSDNQKSFDTLEWTSEPESDDDGIFENSEYYENMQKELEEYFRDKNELDEDLVQVEDTNDVAYEIEKVDEIISDEETNYDYDPEEDQ